MIEYIKLETYKIFKNKQWIAPLITLILFFGLSFYLNTQHPKENQHFFTYYYYIYAINNEIMFPISICIFFSSIYLNEYKLSTIKLLLGSKFERKYIFLGKFISGSIIIFLIFLILTIIYMLLAIVFFTGLDEAAIGLTIINVPTLFGRMVIGFISNMFYLLSIASFVVLLIGFIKKQSIAVLTSLGIIIIYFFIPLPDMVDEYIFLNGRFTYDALTLETLPLDRFIYPIGVSLVTILIFLGLGLLKFDKEEIL
ncbi:ABC transporter permease [Clostridium sp. D2Q-14]|uniref:ABC transporter permease n=1 Tax=Anaeromonas gelatinilytica TaxID=2683194 RepID=UPI00193C1465|nr:ABC transporter permease [Anaeromonas gelatinilytica]